MDFGAGSPGQFQRLNKSVHELTSEPTRRKEHTALARAKRTTHKPLPPLRRFDFGLVQRPLDGILLNVDRDLQRRLKEAGRRNDTGAVIAFTTMVATARFAANSYHAVAYLVADTPEDSQRKQTYVLVLPAINRQLLDLLFSLVYMFDDFHGRLLQYQRAGWREAKEEYQRFHQRFLADPEWKDFFSGRKEVLKHLAGLYGITDAETKKLSNIQRWWTPGSLKDEPTKSRPFLRWLYKWFYQDTSEQAHLSGSGLFMVMPFVMAEVFGGQDQEFVENRAMKQYHYVHVSRTAFITLAIMTELNSFFKLGNEERIGYVWKLFADHSPEGNELFKERYQSMLVIRPQFPIPTDSALAW
jgi:hypothetical protein